MAKTGFYATKTNRKLTPDSASLPNISQALDSVRAYQWEISFQLPVQGVQESASIEPHLTLAAKQVTAMGFTSEAIEVHRTNDKVFYPGKASPEEVTITFDNFYQENRMVGLALWQWFQTTYNPMTGIFSNGISTTTKVQRMDIMHLDSAGTPDYQTSLFGVYPQSWKTAEFNYGTNEFHTIEVVFRYDFMDHTEPLDS